MYPMGIHSIEQGRRIEDEITAREKLIAQFTDWAADFTNGAKLPVAWFMPYKTKEFREAWEKGDDARREFLLEVYRSRNIVAPYEYVRNIDRIARDRYDSERERDENE